MRGQSVWRAKWNGDNYRWYNVGTGEYRFIKEGDIINALIGRLQKIILVKKMSETKTDKKCILGLHRLLEEYRKVNDDRDPPVEFVYEHFVRDLKSKSKGRLGCTDPGLP